MPPSHYDGQINELLSPETKNWRKDSFSGSWEYAPPEESAAFEQYKQRVQASQYPETIIPEHRTGSLWSLRDAAINEEMGPRPRLAPSSQAWVDALKEAATRQAVVASMHVAEERPPYPGAQPVLEWEVDLVLHSGPYDFHPQNQAAKCKVHMKHVQHECQLSDDAVQHMLRIVTWQPYIKKVRHAWRKQFNMYQPNPLLSKNTTTARYNPRTGFLSLWCRRYPDREDNRRHIVLTLHKLVRAGRAAFPTNQAAETVEGLVGEEEAPPFWPYSSRLRLFESGEKEVEKARDPHEPEFKYNRI